MKKGFLLVNVIDKQNKINVKIKEFLKKQGIIYGARSINAQANILTRDTNDYDVFVTNPKKTSYNLQKQLDFLVKGNYFYNKPAIHRGTWKVKNIGMDMKKDTFDDESIADFSKPDKIIRFIKKDGFKYRRLKDEIKAKQKSISNPEFAFRYDKDKNDLDRIKANLKIKKLIR